MCSCIRESAFKEEITVTIPFWVDTSVVVKCDSDKKTSAGHLKGEKKSSNWSDLEGIRKKKRILDEKYREIDMKLGVNPAKRKKKDRKNRIYEI